MLKGHDNELRSTTIMNCACSLANIFPGTRHVGGTGPLKAKIMAIGEAPGADEDQQGIPFSGGAGRILNAWLAKVGISRESIRLDNVVQHRPPGNNIDLADIASEVPSLFKRILEVDPNLILLMGNTPLSVFINLKETGGISDWRGSLFPVSIGGKTYKAFAVYHPAFIMRQRRMWDVTIHDLLRAKRHSETKEYTEEKVNYITEPTVRDLESFVDEALASGKAVSIDIETDFSYEVIDRIGLCFEPGYAISAPFNEDTIYTWLRFFGNVKSTIYQNGYSFDVPKLQAAGLPAKPPTHDTLLYHHVLYNHLPHGLGFLCSVYTDFPYYKWMIRTNKSWYNCRDVDTTLRACYRMLEEMREVGMA